MRLAFSVLCAMFLAACVAERGFPPTLGIANCERVDAHLYRGAQPTQLAIRELARAEVTTVINLRNDPLPGEPDACTEAGLRYVWIPMSGTRAPERERVEKVLNEIAKAPGRVFLHCQFGCDRTGTIVACYRILHGWTNADALREAEAYGMSPMSVAMKQFIRRFK